MGYELADGEGFGNQGPDQGYLFTLVDLLDDDIVLTEGEHRDDVVAGCVTVALKRASLFGRAPVIHDLRAAMQIWGFLRDDPPTELVGARRARFEGAANPHNYAQRRAIADAVPARVLHQPHGAIASAVVADWRATVDLR